MIKAGGNSKLKSQVFKSLGISFDYHLTLVLDGGMRSIVLSLFHLLNLKCWWCWHARFHHTLPREHPAHHTTKSDHHCTWPSPPLTSQWLLTIMSCHGIVLMPDRVCPCSAWLFLGGANSPWLRITLSAQGQEFLCYQQHINTKAHFSEVRLQAKVLCRGSPHTPRCSFICIGYTRRCNCNTRKHA